LSAIQRHRAELEIVAVRDPVIGKSASWGPKPFLSRGNMTQSMKIWRMSSPTGGRERLRALRADLARDAAFGARDAG